MCEAAAYMTKDSREELILESVDLLESSGDEIRLVNMYGEERTIRAKIKALTLVDHRIILEPLES